MTKNNISIRNLSPERAVIDIEGTIGVDENMQFSNPGPRVATYEKLSDTLLRISEIEAPEVVVNIRSTGGDVNDALLIYEALKSLRGRVITCCYGYTASAATVIAQAASPGCRRIASGALYLIHNSVCATEGNVAELVASTDLLRKTDERLAALYAERSGASVEGFVALMAENNGAGRWLSPAEAVEAGLADEVIDDPHRDEVSKGQKASAAGGKRVGNAAEVPAPADNPETESTKEACTADGWSNAADTAGVSAGKSAGRSVDTDAIAAAEKKLGYSAGKPADTSAEKIIGRSADTDAIAAAEKRLGYSAGKSADASAEKIIGRSADTDAIAAAEKRLGYSAGKPAGASAEKIIGRSADTDAIAAAEKRLGYSAGKSADASAEKSVGRSADTDAIAAVEKKPGYSAGKSADASAEKIIGRSADTGTVAAAENHIGGSTDTAVAASVEKSAEKTAEKSAGKPVAGWKTLLRQLRNLFAGSGKKETEGHGKDFGTAALPVDKNILHTDNPDPLREMIRSRIAFNRGQNAVRPTATLPVEDPAACDSHPSANQRAYAEDARRMCL